MIGASRVGVGGGRATRGLAAWALPGLALALLIACGVAGCKKDGTAPKPDAGDGGVIDVKPGTDTLPIDTRTDTVETGPPCMAGDAPKAIGESCGCDAQCGSGHCADGVCCNVACTEGCKTCASVGAPGTCVNRASGDDPRDKTATCAVTPAATCGLDGKCDGSGGCRKYPINTMCKAGMCEGDAVVGMYACDGNGKCKPGSTKICVPYSCDPGTKDCVNVCTDNSQCVSGQQCVNGSCGKRMKGASCDTNDQCASNFCADHVCCNVACAGPCVSCNLMGREGTCWPIEADKADPRQICHDMGASTCGQNGLCDGFGGCSQYARDTVCVPPSCSAGNRLNTAGTCNGLGTCSAPGVQDCHPFRCANGACSTNCTTSADCDTGIACVGGTCGPKQDGQSCTGDGECEHRNCVDKICCDTACTGPCHSCALQSSLGRCTNVAAGTPDPRGMCTATAQTTCGTNGKCDGSGGCQKWPVGTLCADETCNSTGNVYKAPSTCNASGQCEAPPLVACSPYICNATRCFNACTMDSQCVSPNTCLSNSCGLKEPGASCSDPSECRSKFCAQGVCCDQACDGACKSCIAGTPGVCTNVATGLVDPTGKCQVTDAAMCGTNGKCQAGACQKWVPGTPCMPATCPTTSNLFTDISTCDGAGTCVIPGTLSCFPYRCGMAACKATCTADADCQSPATCVNGFCGLKPAGALCANKNECLSNFCEQGLCCQTACTGICKSCALSASRGVCSNIPDGVVDIMSRCSDMGSASCRSDGFCDGKGACRLYGAGTVCAPGSCAMNTATQVNPRTCDGLGVCQTATTLACTPYLCNGMTACLAACTGDQDCVQPNICDKVTSRCGNKKRLGQACTTTNDCLSNNYCVDGVCCSATSCGLCQSCNVGAAAGNCANVPAGTAAPTGQCTVSAAAPCGNTGNCNGNGVCQLAATTASCGTQSCSGNIFTPLSHCDGTGGCLPPTASNCSPYVCSGTSCRNNCSMDSHCVSPFTCQGSGSTRSCALKPLGTACTAANQCGSGSCIDGVCCGMAPGSTSCGTCQTCKGTGTTPAVAAGTCGFLTAGTTAPTGQCAASPPCGNTGICNAGGVCTQAAASVSCGLALSCMGSMLQPASTCTGSGMCNQAPSTNCGNYICGSSTACRTNCTSDAHCANTNLYCNGNATTAGSCVAKKANGKSCGAANECGSGNCTDGVCCTTSSCPACQSCSVNGAGTCANVPDLTADPPNCVASPPCGNTGVCVAGACQQGSTSTACGRAESCTTATYQPPSHCSGTGTCSQTPTNSCGAYKCGTNNMCRSSCASDTDCADGNFCLNGGCMAKRGDGGSCSGDNYCVNAHCVDSTCCNVASCPTCQACNINTVGTCANVGSGSGEPHGRCPTSTTCGNTGACNGGGACQQQPSTLMCGTAVSCKGFTYQPPSFCSGSGTCSQTGSASCPGSLICNQAGTACLTSCNNDDNDCVGGNYCTGPGGSCLPKGGQGATCGADHECSTGNCVDNVCCNMASCGTCQTCNGTTPGQCSALGTITPEADPHGRCPANPPCGNTGLCAGGACQQVAGGTICSGSFCATAASFQAVGTCTGTGSCTIPPPTMCQPYLCGLGGCRNTCTDDSECVGAFYCTGDATTPGICAAKKSNNNNTCARNAECGSGHCTEGYCCDFGTCPSCQSCALPGTHGTCSNLPANSFDPTGTCPIQDVTTCGFNGRCTDIGTCAIYDMNTVCAPGSCSSPDFTTYYCDGLGLGCNQMQTQTCASGCDVNGCLP